LDLVNVYAQRSIQIVEGGPKAINDAYEHRLPLETNAVKLLIARADAADAAPERYAFLPNHLTLRSGRRPRLEGWATVVMYRTLRDATLRVAPQGEVCAFEPAKSHPALAPLNH
jgi:hypothetical protein